MGVTRTLRASKATSFILTSALLFAAAGTAGAATAKPKLGGTCKVSQIGMVSGSLVCSKSGKAGVWRKAPAPPVSPTTTVLDAATAAVGTVLFRETFDSPDASTWKASSGPGWAGDVRDGQFRLAAAPPAPGRVGTGAVLPLPGRVEVAFDFTLTPGVQSKASLNLTCQDSGTANEPFSFLLIDVRPDGRIIASRYDNASATQAPTTFFDRGFSNQDRFDIALLHPRTRVSLRCIRDAQKILVTLSFDGKVVMDTTTPALTQTGDGLTLYMSTFTAGFRDAAELLIDNVVVTKV